MGVYLIGEKNLGKKVLVYRVDLVYIHYCIVAVVNVLKNSSQEGTFIELVCQAQFALVGSVEPLGIYPNPFKGMR